MVRGEDYDLLIPSSVCKYSSAQVIVPAESSDYEKVAAIASANAR